MIMMIGSHQLMLVMDTCDINDILFFYEVNATKGGIHLLMALILMLRKRVQTVANDSVVCEENRKWMNMRPW